MHQPSTTALSLFPDMFKYKTCADSAPKFSLGCMANVTVNIGERATFNCQVSYTMQNLSNKQNLNSIVNRYSIKQLVMQCDAFYALIFLHFLKIRICGE